MPTLQHSVMQNSESKGDRQLYETSVVLDLMLPCEPGCKPGLGTSDPPGPEHFAPKWAPVRHRNREKCTKSGAHPCSILVQIDSISSRYDAEAVNDQSKSAPPICVKRPCAGDDVTSRRGVPTLRAVRRPPLGSRSPCTPSYDARNQANGHFSGRTKFRASRCASRATTSRASMIDRWAPPGTGRSLTPSVQATALRSSIHLPSGDRSQN
jgi:hypothetical protein